MNKTQDKEHRELVARATNQPVPELDPIGGADWTVETKLGNARVSVTPGDSSIYWRFTGPADDWLPPLAQYAPPRDSLPGSLNPFSGKWNLHATGPDPVAESQFNAAKLKSRLRMIDGLQLDAVVPVLFRILPDDGPDAEPFAVFPTLPGTRDPESCTFYARLGQHGTGHYTAMMKVSRPATEEEARPLKHELCLIGYRMTFPDKLRPGDWFRQRCQELV